jgi:hypothetical protein
MGVDGYATPLTIGYLGIGCFHVTASVTRYLGSDVSVRRGFNCRNIMINGCEAIVEMRTGRGNRSR